MGSQLSILIGCVGALEILACLRHFIVCVYKIEDPLGTLQCNNEYFHRPVKHSYNKVCDKKEEKEEKKNELIVEKPIIKEVIQISNTNETENLLGTQLLDGYIRIPTPIPFILDDEIPRSSSIDSSIDSANDIAMNKSNDNLSVIAKKLESSSSSVSSMEEEIGNLSTWINKSPSKIRRSKSPYDKRESEDDQNIIKKVKTKSSSNIKRTARSRQKIKEIGRSVESLVTEKLKKNVELERSKSEQQLNTKRDYRDEWTNTSPFDSDSGFNNKLNKKTKSISVLIQTSFDNEDNNNEFKSTESLFHCPNCSSKEDLKLIEKSISNLSINKNDIKVSSFENAKNDDYNTVKNLFHKNDTSVNENNNNNEDDENRAPIQYTIPDLEDENKAFWLIFSGEYTKAMNKDWHNGHFCCWQCDESLTGQRYVLRDEHPYCIKCYESVFANGCEECHKMIGIDSKDLSYKDKHWHEACFLCQKCRASLVDKQFGSKLDKIYCGNCYDAQFASRCDGCGEIFRAGTKKMEYKTRQWHEKCFCCVVCRTPIGTKSFIPREQEIYCAGCYEDKFATRCVKCNKIITSGGVTYKNEPWHRECFTCTHCDNSLAGQRFTSRDEKPYCAECFGELFAKRCTACSKPITGIGGTRFISFEDRHWHNDCFICAGCNTTLVGRGFITDGPDIICPECAKEKLS